MYCWLLTTCLSLASYHPSPEVDKSKMMLKTRSRRNASVLFITTACFCLQEGKSEGPKHHLSASQMVISNSFMNTWPINTIGNVHNASQCADSDVTIQDSGDCCSLRIDDRQCRDGYKVSSVSFEECQKTDELCSTYNGCFSCVISPPGKDTPSPPPPQNHEIQPRMREHPALNVTAHMHSSGSPVRTDRFLALQMEQF
jgi:hypothetical protein